MDSASLKPGIMSALASTIQSISLIHQMGDCLTASCAQQKGEPQRWSAAADRSFSSLTAYHAALFFSGGRWNSF